MGKRRRAPKADPGTWSTRLVAAAELAVILEQPTMTAETLHGWTKDPACPLPHGRGPIAKAPLLQWLLTTKRPRGRPPDPDNEKARHAQAQILEAKAATLLGKMIRRDQAKQAVQIACDELRRDLTEEIPRAIGEMVGKRTADEIVDESRQLMVEALNRFSARANGEAA